MTDRVERNYLLAGLVLRIALCIQIVGSRFFASNSASVPKTIGKNWLLIDLPSGMTVAVTLLLAAASVTLAIGLAIRLSACITGAMLLIIEWTQLHTDPLYNFSEAIGLLVAMVVAILLLTDPRLVFGLDDLRRKAERRHTASRWSDGTLLLRLFIGSIFIAQGWNNIFQLGGIIGFARSVYVAPYQSALPDWLLWIAGVSNPPWELVGGGLIFVGLFTSEAAIGMCGFLLTIIFGHVLQDGAAATAGMRDYALANLASVLAVLLMQTKGNRWSMDYLLAVRRSTKVSL